jgi:hypothetical protein
MCRRSGRAIILGLSVFTLPFPSVISFSSRATPQRNSQNNMKKANVIGIFVAIIGMVGTVASGQTPILQYTFNESGTSVASTGLNLTPLTFIDASGSAADLHSADALGVSGLPGDRAFDNTASTGMGIGGVGGAALLPANSFGTLSSFTFQCWFNASVTPGNAARLLEAGSFAVFAGETSILYCNGLNARASTTAYGEANQWIFFAVTYDSTQTENNVAFYYGTETTPVTQVGSYETLNGGPVADNQQVTVGNYNAGNYRPFQGYLDDLRLFGSASDSSGVLSQSQLETIRQQDINNVHTVATVPIIHILSTHFLFTAGDRISIIGQVTDTNGNSMAGIPILAEDPLLRQSRIVGTSDARGHFTLSYSAAETSTLTSGVYLVQLSAAQTLFDLTINIKRANLAYVPLPDLTFTPGPIGNPLSLTQPGRVLSFRTDTSTPLTAPSDEDTLTVGLAIARDSGNWLAGEGGEFISDPVNDFAIVSEVSCFVPLGQGVCAVAGNFLIQSAAHQLVVDAGHTIINSSTISSQDKASANAFLDGSDLLYSAVTLDSSGGLAGNLDALSLTSGVRTTAVELLKDSNGNVTGLQCAGISAGSGLSCGISARQRPQADVPTSGVYECLLTPQSNSSQSNQSFEGRAQADPLSQTGVVTIVLGKNYTFTADLVIAATNYRFKGQFGPSGDYSGTISAPNEPTIAVSLHLDTASGLATISGTAGGLGVAANHAAYNAKDEAPEIGYYTVLLLSDTSTGILPYGTGIATVRVGKGGSVKLAGRLADGTPFNVGTVLTGNTQTAGNQIVLYAPLGYRSTLTKAVKGFLIGTLTFEKLPGTSDFDGTLEWIKPQQNRGNYQAAFNTDLNVIGSLYTAPGRKGSALPGFPVVGSTSSGILELSDTNGIILSGTTQLSSANKLAIINLTDNVKIAITPSTGVFKGTFVYPNQTKLTAFSGLFFQDQASGGGYFLGPKGGGSVSLGPSP